MKRWVNIVLISVFAVMFLISGGYMINYYINADKETGQFDELAAMMEQGQQKNDAQKPAISNPDGTSVEVSDSPLEEQAPVLVDVLDPDTGETVQMLSEFAELYTINSDIIGWMRVDGTDINHPVMHRPENTDYYLHKDFYGDYSGRGCFYVREACSVSPHSDNITVYGHNMFDGTMMADLHKYKQQSFWEEHKYITFNSLTEYRQYEVIAAFRIESSTDSDFQYHLFVDAEAEEEFDEFVANVKEHALYDTGITPQYGDKLLTLSTCDRSIHNGRMVVICKLITE